MSETSKTCQFCGVQLVVCHEATLGHLADPTHGIPAEPPTPRRLHCNNCGICYEDDGKSFFGGLDPRIIAPGAAPVIPNDSLNAAHESLQTEHAKTLEELKKADHDLDLLEKENQELKAQIAAKGPTTSSSKG